MKLSPGHQPLDEILLDLAEDAAAEPDPDHRLGDDGADIHTVAAGVDRQRHDIGAVRVAAQALVAVLALERVAAGGHEFERLVEIGAGKARGRAPAAVTSR